ncbi:MAG TPA: transposase, partial [Xanthomonadaceae bacterium]|nr:transposase [Xanthomonadaceae bacterium]
MCLNLAHHRAQLLRTQAEILRQLDVGFKPELGLSAFDAHYCNNETGATAHDPAMLLRAVLLGYSQGLVSSRAIERACRDNVLFIAITGDAKPHFTTIAA